MGLVGVTPTVPFVGVAVPLSVGMAALVLVGVVLESLVGVALVGVVVLPLVGVASFLLGTPTKEVNPDWSMSIAIIPRREFSPGLPSGRGQSW